jgi:hypothetical protein
LRNRLTIIIVILSVSLISQMYGQNIKPESGLFYYTDTFHTTEIEFFPGNSLCVINTTFDIAMFESACGTYHWRGDTLVFDVNPNQFLEKHLQIDTLGCQKGEVLLHLKTIAPLEQPEWRSIISPLDFFLGKGADSLRLISGIELREMQYRFSWSEIEVFDTLKLGLRGSIKGPSIPIPDASCMNVEYPVLRQLRKGDKDNLYEYNEFVFSEILNGRAQITMVKNHSTFTKVFEYIIRDPFGQ